MKIFALLFIAILTGCVGHHVPKPRSDVKFTSKVGWWSYQKNLKVDSLKVEVIDSSLNLFNSTSLIRIRIRGEMKGQNQWRPQIDVVHISERVLHGDNYENSVAEIHLTPIIKVKEDLSYKSKDLYFELTQEIHLESMGWGANTYRIICGSQVTEVKLHQSK